MKTTAQEQRCFQCKSIIWHHITYWIKGWSGPICHLCFRAIFYQKNRPNPHHPKLEME